MLDKIYPKKLQSGDELRVIAPARSLKIIRPELREIAKARFAELDLTLSFGAHVEECDDFLSSSISSRVADIHAAFSDPKVSGILTVIGGFNSNQLLHYLDWDLIKKNPKIFCGYSDITALNNAIYAKTGLVNYSGPHYSSFGMQLGFEYSLEYFKKCLMQDSPFTIHSSSEWSDDAWFKDQINRKFVPHQGYQVIQPGQAQGTILGANLCTFNLLQGTQYFPDLTDSILFLEDDDESKAVAFDRDLQSLIHQPGFSRVRGLVIGRFQTASEINLSLLSQIIKSKPELAQLPVIAEADFGHTDPRFTFPIGGEARVIAQKGVIELEILNH